MRIECLTDKQRAAVDRLTSAHVKPEHTRRDMRIAPSWIDRSVYVTVTGRLAPDTPEYSAASPAERFHVSGFHALIGPRGGVKLFK